MGLAEWMAGGGSSAGCYRTTDSTILPSGLIAMAIHLRGEVDVGRTGLGEHDLGLGATHVLGWHSVKDLVACCVGLQVVAACGFTLVSAPALPAGRSIVIYASSAGARMDSDLASGGGTDDTAVLQAILNRAADGMAVNLVIDGAALVTGLDVYGNTTIECPTGSGLFLKAGSNRAIIRNAHRSRRVVSDEHITIRGCFLNGNRKNQISAELPPRPDLPLVASAKGAPSNKEIDGTYLSGLQFLGVRSLLIDGVTLWNVRAFGALIGNSSRVDIRNIVIDHGETAENAAEYGNNTDGLHFKGPLQYLTIDGAKIRVGDDSIALNADDYETEDLTLRNDFGPYVTQGPITDVLISNIEFMGSLQGIRLLSSRQRIDRVNISNVIGTVRGGYVLNISHWMNPTSYGNIGSILVSNVNVDREFPPELEANVKAVLRPYLESSTVVAKEYDNGDWPPNISVNAHVEVLTLKDIVTHVSDRHAIVRVGPDADILSMTVGLTLIDPRMQATPIKVEKGSRVGQMNVVLVRVPDEAKTHPVVVK